MRAMHPNHLTPKQVADELGISADGVRKLVRRRKLAGTKLSAHQIVISRAALDAYKRRLNGGQAFAYTPPEVADLDELRAAFTAAVSTTPEAWLAAYKSGDIPETPETLTIASQASALRAAELAAVAGGPDASDGQARPRAKTSRTTARHAPVPIAAAPRR